MGSHSDWMDRPELDAVMAAPESHEVIFEDETVRVVRVVIDPGVKEPVHTHVWPSHMLVYASSPLRYYDDQGGVVDIPESMSKRPKAEWMAPEGPHAVENVGEKRYEAVRVEYKGL